MIYSEKNYVSDGVVMERKLVDLQDFVKRISEKYGDRDVYRYIEDDNIISKSFKTFEKDIYSVEALLQNNVLNAKKLLDLLAEITIKEDYLIALYKVQYCVNRLNESRNLSAYMFNHYLSELKDITYLS